MLRVFTIRPKTPYLGGKSGSIEKNLVFFELVLALNQVMWFSLLMMKNVQITINQTAEGLDPNATTENPEQSLIGFVKELSAEILKEFPDAEIVFNEIDDTKSITISDDPDGSCSERVQAMAEDVYEAGNFWN